jgi:hypothetical protein
MVFIMKAKNVLVKTGQVINNAAIYSTSAAAGATVLVYCADHDICNDQDTSIIVGIGAGTGTAIVTTTVLKAVENAAYNGARKVAGFVSSKFKKNDEKEQGR